MKKIFIQILGLMSTTICCAQDLIVKNNGDEIQVKVLSVDEDKVSYKKWSNKNGPTYSLGTDKIFMIKYQNGDKDVFSAKDSGIKSSVADNSSKDGATGYVEKQPIANNTELIKKYNPEVQFDLKPKNSKSKPIIAIMAVNNSSVLSNDEVEMNIVRHVVQSKYDLSVLRYYIEIKNKTDNMIYIDKGNSFKIINDIATPFYDTKQVSVTSGNASGASLGLGSIASAIGVDGVAGQIAGGLSVGGGSSSSVSTTYSQQRILTIPPHSSAYISEHKWDNYKGNKWQQISEAEDFKVTYNGKPVKTGQYIEFNNNTSPCKYKYLITYSTEPDFKFFSYLNADLYIRYIVGASARVRGMNAYPCCPDSYSNTSHLYHWYNKVIPNFESVPSMLVGVTSWQ